MVPTAELFMSDAAKACSRSAKKRTTWRSTHKNRTTDAIPNQNSVLLLLGPSMERGGVGMSDVAKACSRSAKKRIVWRSCDAQKQSG
jgi:hypothetical protein